MKDLNIGDIVYLNNGSPKLLVAGTCENNKGTDVYVVWMDINNQIQKSIFDSRMLTDEEPK